MTTESCCKILRFVSGNLTVATKKDIYGKALEVQNLGETLCVQKDDKCFYFDTEKNKCLSVNKKYLRGKKTYFDEIPENALPELKEFYLHHVQRLLKIKSTPDWFRVRFLLVEIKKQFPYDNEAAPYYEQRFVIAARNTFYFLNSSNEIEHMKYKKGDTAVIHEYETGEFPEGTTQDKVVNFCISLDEELKEEYNEFLNFKNKFGYLIEQKKS